MTAEIPLMRVFTPRAWSIVGGEPDRVAHAATQDGLTTLCGLQVANLVEFPDSVYTDLRRSLRCDGCDDAAGLSH